MNKSVPRNRTPVVIGASLVQFTVIGGVFAYGVFFSVLETELGWSRSTLSACTSLAFLVMGLLAISAGRLNDRFGPRWVLAGSGIIYGCGYASLSTVNEPWLAIVTFGLAIGVGMSTHDVVTLSTIARWFNAKRGRMTAVVKVGTACGQIIVPLIAAVLIGVFGWRQAFLLLGLGALIILLFSAWLIGDKPPALNDSDDALNQHQGLDFKQVSRIRQFWLICGMQFMLFASLMTIPVHIVIHAQDLGFDATTAAAVLSSIGAVSILLISLLFLRHIDEPRYLFGFAALYGFAHGGFFTVVSPTLAEYFGMQALGTVFGAVVFFGAFSGSAGPFIAGWIFDSTGSYEWAFTLLAVLATCGLIMALSLTRLKFDHTSK